MALATRPPIAGSRKRQQGSTASIVRPPPSPMTAVTHSVLSVPWHQILDAIERLQAKAPAEGEKVHSDPHGHVDQTPVSDGGVFAWSVVDLCQARAAAPSASQ